MLVIYRPDIRYWERRAIKRPDGTADRHRTGEHCTTYYVVGDVSNLLPRYRTSRRGRDQTFQHNLRKANDTVVDTGPIRQLEPKGRGREVLISTRTTPDTRAMHLYIYDPCVQGGNGPR